MFLVFHDHSQCNANTLCNAPTPRFLPRPTPIHATPTQVADQGGAAAAAAEHEKKAPTLSLLGHPKAVTRRPGERRMFFSTGAGGL